jgi:hypothetical protein
MWMIVSELVLIRDIGISWEEITQIGKKYDLFILVIDCFSKEHHRSCVVDKRKICDVRL